MDLRNYDLKDIYSDAHNQLGNLLSVDDLKTITAKTQPDDLKSLVDDAIRQSSNPDSVGRARDVIQGLVVRLKKFEGAIDMIVQSSPQIMGLNLAGLIWGGLKFVLVIVGDASDTLNMVVDLLDEVLKGLPVLETYVEIFGTSTTQLLRAPLTDLYAALIAFVVMAVRLLSGSKRGTIGRSLDGSMQNNFKSLFVRIEKAGKEVDRVANVEHMRDQKLFQQETRFLLTQINNQESNVCRSTPFIEVPLGYLSAHFTGREDELAKVEQLLGGSFGDSPTRCVIHGMPGLGKTQLCLQFAKQAYARKLYTHILWISATSEEKLNQGYCKALDLFGHQDRLHPDQSVKLSAAQRWLEGYEGGWLLIFDNVGGMTLDFLRQYLPRQNCRGRMLFTTRTEDIAEAVAEGQHHILALQPLNPRAATNLLLMEAKLGDTPNEAQAGELVRRVGCLPLMVSQAASLVRAQKTLDILLDMDPRQQNLHVIGWENKLTKYEATSVKTVFLRQFEALERQSLTTSHLMRVLSFLDPECIPLSILEAGAAKLLDDSPPSMAVTSRPKSIRRRLRRRWDKFRSRFLQSSGAQAADDFFPSPDLRSLLTLICTPGQLQIAVQQLRDLSLVGYQSEQNTATLRIHDVIQATVQDLGSKADNQEEWFEAAAQLVCSALSLIEDHGSVECWVECEELVLHVQSLSTWNDPRRRELSILLGANQDIAEFFESKGRYHEAGRLLEWVLETRNKTLGVRHRSTLNTVDRLAGVYESQGRYVEAEKLYLRALEGREKKLGVDHPSTLTTVNNLALLYKSQGRYSEAEKLHRRALEGQEKQLGVEHPSTLITTNNLAIVYSSQGRDTEAELLYVRALEAKEKQLGVEHPSTLTTVNNLASVYSSQGRDTEAELLYVRALEAQEKQLGVDHPFTLTTVSNLAGVYESQGRHIEAELLYVRALETMEKELGVEHPDTLTVADNLAGVYSSQGRYSEAEKLHLRALEGQEKQLGVDHPSTLTTMNNLALVYYSQGRYTEAEPLYVRALEAKEKQLGVEHPSTLTTMNNLAGVYESQGRLSEAEKLHLRALEGQEKQLGVEHPSTLITMNNLALVYNSQGRYTEAEPLYVQVLEAKEKQLGVEDPSTLITVNNLALVYSSQGRNGEAETLYTRVLEGEEKQLGAEHPSTMITVNNFASLYESQGRYSEAEALYTRALDGRKKTLGPEHPDTLSTANSLAQCQSHGPHRA